MKTTLRASGFIISKGKRIKLKLGREFRPAKKEPTRVVQKRRYRLGTRSEVVEIKRAKQKKRRKNVFGI